MTIVVTTRTITQLRPRTAAAVAVGMAEATQATVVATAAVAPAIVPLHQLRLQMTATLSLFTKHSRTTTRLWKLRLIQMPVVVSSRICRRYVDLEDTTPSGLMLTVSICRPVRSLRRSKKSMRTKYSVPTDANDGNCVGETIWFRTMRKNDSSRNVS